jgi:hypothetical protein
MSDERTGSDAEPQRQDARKRWFQRHPGLALLAVNAGLFLFLAIVAEIFLRLFIPYNPGFYTAVKVKGTELVHPYGIIKINSEGFPDEEFDLSKPHRVGYFGDSVTYGVGAGYGYRISEVLEEAYPEFEHMNVGGVGLSISGKEVRWATDLAVRLGMEKVIYLFNLNDILPTKVASGEKKTRMVSLRERIILPLDWLRGRSYLYTALRNWAKTAIEARGIGFHGYRAFELFPTESRQVVEETAERVNEFARSLDEHGIELVVVILPYEMQISEEAARVYASKGVQWEPDFIERTTQIELIAALDPSIPVYDAYFAFVDPDDPEASRARHGVGEFFVYDKGDKLDWNHPNRAGHRAIARYLIEQDILGPEPAPVDHGAATRSAAHRGG